MFIIILQVYSHNNTFMVFKGEDGRLFHFIKHNIFHLPTCILKIQVEKIFINIL